MNTSQKNKIWFRILTSNPRAVRGDSVMLPRDFLRRCSRGEALTKKQSLLLHFRRHSFSLVEISIAAHSKNPVLPVLCSESPNALLTRSRKMWLQRERPSQTLQICSRGVNFICPQRCQNNSNVKKEENPAYSNLGLLKSGCIIIWKYTIPTVSSRDLQHPFVAVDLHRALLKVVMLQFARSDSLR